MQANSPNKQPKPYTVPTAIEEIRRYFTQLEEYHETWYSTVWDLMPADYEFAMNMIRLLSTRIDFLYDNAAAGFFENELDAAPTTPHAGSISVTAPAELWHTVSQITAWPPSSISECEAVTDLMRTARRAVDEHDGNSADAGTVSPPPDTPPASTVTPH